MTRFWGFIAGLAVAVHGALILGGVAVLVSKAVPALWVSTETLNHAAFVLPIMLGTAVAGGGFPGLLDNEAGGNNAIYTDPTKS
jgi:ABC-type sugar transport system permease subunit